MANYSSLTSAKRHLGLSSSDTSQDDLISEWLTLLTQAIDRYCHRPLAQRTETHVFDWSNSFRLWLDDWLQSVTTLTNGNGQVLTAGTHFLYYPHQGPPYYWLEIKRNSGQLFMWSGTTQSAITVAGVWGRNTADLVTAGIAANLWLAALMTRRGQEGIQSERFEDIAVSFNASDPSNPPGEVQTLLKPLRWTSFMQTTSNDRDPVAAVRMQQF